MLCERACYEIGNATYVLELPLLEKGNAVHDHEGSRAAEVDDLVHDEAHDAGGEDIVLHPEVPGRPEALGDVELDIILGDLLEDVGKGDGR